MRSALIALALLSSVSAANAQVVVQLPGVIPVVVDDFWQRPNGGERDAEWRQRREFREEAFERQEWQRRHCVREWDGAEYCRR